MLRVIPRVFLAACAGKAVTLSHPDLDAEATRTQTIDVPA